MKLLKVIIEGAIIKPALAHELPVGFFLFEESEEGFFFFFHEGYLIFGLKGLGKANKSFN